MQYGRIVNNKLFRAPRRMTYEGCNSDSFPREVYLKFGYKPIISNEPPQTIQNGKVANYYWKETDDSIIQTWTLDDLDYDYAENLRESKGRFNLSVLRLKECINEYKLQKDNAAKNMLDSDELLKIAYDKLCLCNPDMRFDVIMSKYEKSIPLDFFTEIDLSDTLEERGFVLNRSDHYFTTSDRTIIQDISQVENREGAIYLCNTDRQLFFVSHFAAIKYQPDNPPIIIDPMDFHFFLSRIAEVFGQGCKPNTQYTMAFSYLHTLMDEFLTSTLRFFVNSFPIDADIDSKIIARDLFSAQQLEQLRDKVIEDKINNLGYDNYRNKIDYLNKKGISCSIEQSVWSDDMIWFCEKRNAIVHNSGIVSKMTLQKIRGTRHASYVKLDDNISPGYDEICDAIELVKNVCDNLYNVMRDKFSL